MSASSQSVCAVLVTTAEDEDFLATLQAVYSQRQALAPSLTTEESPQILPRTQNVASVEILVIDASDKGVIAPDSLPDGTHFYHARSAPNFGRAIDEALRSQHLSHMLKDAHYLWLLHADSTPEPDCLEHLLTTAHSGTTIAVVGPKLVDVTGTRALAVGINATRSARRQETSLPEEIDQGQHDGRLDVLAVSTAGMLVTTEAWRATGGFDPLLGPYGDDLEFGRRVRRLGYRVVVSPKARLIHHRRSWNVKDSLTPLLRARTYNWLMAAPGWQLPVLMVYAVISAPIRAVIFALLGQGNRAWSEALTGLYVLADSPHLIARRLWLHRHARVPRHALTGLELPARALRERRREMRRGVERLHGTEVSPALAAAVRLHRSRALVAATVTTAVLSVFAAVMWTPYLDGIAGAAWAQLPSSWSALWEAAWTPWIPGGDGAPGVSDPSIAILAFLTAPPALLGINPADAAPWFLAVSLPAAGVAGWALASTLTLRVGARTAVALVWAASPALTVSATSGRLSAVLFHIALPLTVAAWLKLLGLRYRRELAGEISSVVSPSRTRMRWWGPAACGTGVLSGLLPAAFFAALILVATATLAVLVGTRRGLRATTWPLRTRLARAWTALLPSAILVIPSALNTFIEGGQGAFLAYLTSTGPSHASAVPVPWELILGMPQRFSGTSLFSSHGLLWCVLAMPTVLVGVWAMLRAVQCIVRWPAQLQVQTRWRKHENPAAHSEAVSELWRHWMPPIAVLSAGMMFILAYGLRFIPVGLSDNGSPTYAWPATFLSTAGMCLLIAVCAPTGRSVGERRLYQGLGLVALATLVTVMGVTQGVFTLPLGERIHAAEESALPVASVHAQESTRQARVLYVDASVEPMMLRLYRGRGPVMTDSSALTRYEELAGRVHEETPEMPRDRAWDSLATAALTVMTTPDTASVEALAEHGIDAIVVASPAYERSAVLIRALDRAPGIERGAESEAGASWRIRPRGMTPARAMLVPDRQTSAETSPEVYAVLDSAGFRATGYTHEAGRLHLAERASEHWVLRANGQILPPVKHEWAQAWMIPGEAELTLSYEMPWMTAWKWLLIACTIVTLAGCIPGGRKT